MSTEVKTVPIKAYSKKELTRMYGVGANTFNDWLKLYSITLNGSKFKNLLTPKEVTQVFTALGEPPNKLEEC